MEIGGGSVLNMRGSHSYTCIRLPLLPASIIWVACSVQKRAVTAMSKTGCAPQRRLRAPWGARGRLFSGVFSIVGFESKTNANKDLQSTRTPVDAERSP